MGFTWRTLLSLRRSPNGTDLKTLVVVTFSLFHATPQTAGMQCRICLQGKARLRIAYLPAIRELSCVQVVRCRLVDKIEVAAPRGNVVCG